MTYCVCHRYVKCLKSTTFPEFHKSLATMMVCSLDVHVHVHVFTCTAHKHVSYTAHVYIERERTAECSRYTGIVPVHEDLQTLQ